MERDEKLVTEIAEAMEANDLNRVQELFRENPEYLHLDVYGSWLNYASRAGLLNAVELLVRLGLDVNGHDTIDPAETAGPEGPICSAVTGGSTEIVKFLLDKGANSNCVVDGEVRNFALSSAARNGRLDLVKLLVEHGADVNATWAGMNALSNSRGKKEIEDFLRSQGAIEPWRALGEKLESPQDAIVSVGRGVGHFVGQ